MTLDRHGVAAVYETPTPRVRCRCGLDLAGATPADAMSAHRRHAGSEGVGRARAALADVLERKGVRT